MTDLERVGFFLKSLTAPEIESLMGLRDSHIETLRG